MRRIGALRRPESRLDSPLDDPEVSGWPLRDEFGTLRTTGLSPIADSLGWSVSLLLPFLADSVCKGALTLAGFYSFCQTTK
jgi:hypothetical protein